MRIFRNLFISLYIRRYLASVVHLQKLHGVQWDGFVNSFGMCRSLFEVIFPANNAAQINLLGSDVAMKGTVYFRILVMI